MLIDELLAKYRDQMIAPTATGQASSMPQMPKKDYIGAIGKKPKVSRIFDKEQINTAGTLGGAGLASMARLLQTWNNVDATNESEAIKDYEDRLKHAMDLDKSQETMQHKLDFEGLSPNDAAEREYKGAATDRIRQDMAFDAEKHPLDMQYKQARIDAALRRGATTHANDATTTPMESSNEEGNWLGNLVGNIFGSKTEDNISKSLERLNVINQKMQQPGLTKNQLYLLAKQFASEKAIYQNLVNAKNTGINQDFKREKFDFTVNRDKTIFDRAKDYVLGTAAGQQEVQDATLNEKPIYNTNAPKNSETMRKILEKRYPSGQPAKSRVDDAMDYLFAQ